LHLQNKAAQAWVIGLHTHCMSLINSLTLNGDEHYQLAWAKPTRQTCHWERKQQTCI